MKLLAVAIIGLCVVIGINRHEIVKQRKRIRELEDVVTDIALRGDFFDAFDESEDDNDVEA